MTKKVKYFEFLVPGIPDEPNYKNLSIKKFEFLMFWNLLIRKFDNFCLDPTLDAAVTTRVTAQPGCHSARADQQSGQLGR